MLKVQRPKRIHNQEGMALVLTLIAVSFLVAVTVQLATSVNWQMQGAGNLRDSVQLDAMNRSGLSLARAALLADLEDNKEVDTLHDSWGNIDTSSLFGSGTLNVDVKDLSGRLQVNALVPEEKKDPNKFKEQQDKQIGLWKRFLVSGQFVADDDEADEIIDAIIDWIDDDDNERDNGAESGFYRSLSPSYEARDAPVTYPEELLLIRGMTNELFYGIKEYLTVAGRDGMININTAPLKLLKALNPDGNMSDETASDLDEYRKDEDNLASLAEPQWYKLVNSGLELDEDIAVVISRNFEVSVTAEYKAMTRNGTGILQRVGDKGEQNLLYWEVR